MNIDVFKTIQTIDPSKIASYNEFFDKEIYLHADVREGIWKALHEQCKGMTPQEQYTYRHTYYGWYVALTWRMLRSVSLEDFLTYVIPFQIPVAYLRDLDVMDQMMWYFSFQAFGIEEIQALYGEIQELVKNSSAIVGKWQGKEGMMTLKDVFEKVSFYDNSSNTDSLARAQFFTDFEKSFFDGVDVNNEKHPVITDDIVDNFFSFVRFILDIDVDNIWYMVEQHNDPFKYALLKQAKQQASSPIKESSVSLDSPPVDTAEAVPDIADPPSSIDFSKIKERVITELWDSATDTQILTKLAELSETQADQRIRDLYYYDEEQEKFVWNDQLLIS
ncbi:MAG: hypothetical protein GW939_00255 [Candidatus Magasanikbacteria bacterium]|uniref:Uncharacterized protein n=1 Tax=Candidatus Magasanikbacteria bacterium CG10_big_fil_rev_8_21_14_0_10_38_6 TaxID=1974647 RepID=A0A2M6NZM0_9BACT|nr:hypothetical protein [Candidatus Magasanikbacteria bacterium]PIR76904.1 MAG: hypothetical protein COU30_05375 [Candidatus Magasanikbacteria bacterium CG10_big_fil_rev_8_21_14_0_10_38_6]